MFFLATAIALLATFLSGCAGNYITITCAAQDQSDVSGGAASSCATVTVSGNTPTASATVPVTVPVGPGAGLGLGGGGSPIPLPPMAGAQVVPLVQPPIVQPTVRQQSRPKRLDPPLATPQKSSQMDKEWEEIQKEGRAAYERNHPATLTPPEYRNKTRTN